MGRTGKMYACEHTGVVPDILCLAKGIASGLPLSATVAKADIMNWHPGAHASTFGGNPVAIASALKTFELLEKGVLENSNKMGERLIAGLRTVAEKHSNIVFEVRGLGLMIGVELVSDKETNKPDAKLRDRVEVEAFKRGLILQGAGESTVRFSPPLIIDEYDVDTAVRIFDEALSAAVQ
jgi:4-aminobutyrate aminotransferase